MLVVIDTNVWVSELALNSTRGAVVRFYLGRRGATLAVPEVIRLELHEHLVQELQTRAARIRDDYDRLLAVFGELKEIVIPDEVQIEALALGFVDSLDVPVREIPLSLESARSSFLKTIHKTPPSAQSQQFKDGAIWADCVALLEEDDVWLVSSDKAFYSGRDYGKGIAAELSAEVDGASHTLTLVPDLATLLDGIRVDFELDPQPLIDELMARFAGSYGQLLEEHGYALAGTSGVDTTLFATEVATRLFVEFTARFECPDALSLGRPSAELVFSGTGVYDSAAGCFTETQMENETLTYTDDEGEKQARSVYAVGGMINIGHASVRHSLRVPLQ